MQARMKNPALVIPGALPAALAFAKVVNNGSLPANLRFLICLRASQINGCGFCVDMHSRELKQAGETEQRIWAVGAWRESPHFSDAERAALDLTEYATRMSDRPDAVPDAVFDAAKQHFDEAQLAALILNIGLINLFNRINVVTRQPAGAKLG